MYRSYKYAKITSIFLYLNQYALMTPKKLVSVYRPSNCHALHMILMI